MAKIEGILLDLDDTVYDYKEAHTPALHETVSWLAQKLGRSTSEIENAYTTSRQAVNTRLAGLASSHSRLLYFQGICETYGNWPCEIALEAEEIYWKTFLSKMQLRQDCLDFLRAIKPRPVAIVTDLTAQVQFAKMARLGLKEYVQAIVTSEEVGREKPHASMFETATRKLSLAPEQVCMIGDSFERDMQGALACGMPCFWYRNGTGTDPAYNIAGVKQFSQFGELLEMVTNCG